ncbi:VOC family protein [Nocardioides daeguensis]|uniref:VOC family protein n=1 Tax=Nocardioides daeguensis TaxID=908359 RepID=UPI00214A5EA4|nr:VOC family protein [Nocardioides daeguensis]MCR1774722.1 VOC family protein [Nocardioides daeguensis]
MTSVRQVQVTFDCASPRAVADFWKAALGYVDPPHPPDPEDTWAACQDPEGVGPRLYFQRVPEAKAAKNRVHLDVRVATGLDGDERLAALEAEASRLEALGARRGTLLLADGENESCQNMFDVEGNEFCLD